MKKVILSMIAVAGMLTSQAQVKEGCITYTIKATGIPAGAESFFAGAEAKSYFKDKKFRNDFSTAMFSKITTADDKQMTNLDDRMGQKSFYVRKKASLEKEAKGKPEPKITYVDETKTIAGYECKKAIVESKSEKGEVEKSEVWYCEKIQRAETVMNLSSKSMKGLKGVPFEYDLSVGNGIVMHFTASNVSTSPVPDGKFVAPTEGYTETTYEEEMKKMEAMRKQQGGQ